MNSIKPKSVRHGNCGLKRENTNSYKQTRRSASKYENKFNKPIKRPEPDPVSTKCLNNNPHWDPQFRIPRRPLVTERVYHFNVIYNHALCPASRTEDTDLALRVTTAMVERLELMGFVNSYYHDRDHRPNNSLTTELERVLAGSSITILLLTPGFIGDSLNRYLNTDVVRQLLDHPRPNCRLINLSIGVPRERVPCELSPEFVFYFREDWEIDIPTWNWFDNVVLETLSSSTSKTRWWPDDVYETIKCDSTIPHVGTTNFLHGSQGRFEEVERQNVLRNAKSQKLPDDVGTDMPENKVDYLSKSMLCQCEMCSKLSPDILNNDYKFKRIFSPRESSADAFKSSALHYQARTRDTKTTYSGLTYKRQTDLVEHSSLETLESPEFFPTFAEISARDYTNSHTYSEGLSHLSTSESLRRAISREAMSNEHQRVSPEIVPTPIYTQTLPSERSYTNKQCSTCIFDNHIFTDFGNRKITCSECTYFNDERRTSDITQISSSQISAMCTEKNSIWPTAGMANIGISRNLKNEWTEKRVSDRCIPNEERRLVSDTTNYNHTLENTDDWSFVSERIFVTYTENSQRQKLQEYQEKFAPGTGRTHWQSDYVQDKFPLNVHDFYTVDSNRLVTCECDKWSCENCGMWTSRNRQETFNRQISYKRDNRWTMNDYVYDICDDLARRTAANLDKRKVSSFDVWTPDSLELWIPDNYNRWAQDNMCDDIFANVPKWEAEIEQYIRHAENVNKVSLNGIINRKNSLDGDSESEMTSKNSERVETQTLCSDKLLTSSCGEEFKMSDLGGRSIPKENDKLKAEAGTRFVLDSTDDSSAINDIHYEKSAVVSTQNPGQTLITDKSSIVDNVEHDSSNYRQDASLQSAAAGVFNNSNGDVIRDIELEIESEREVSSWNNTSGKNRSQNINVTRSPDNDGRKLRYPNGSSIEGKNVYALDAATHNVGSEDEQEIQHAFEEIIVHKTQSKNLDFSEISKSQILLDTLPVPNLHTFPKALQSCPSENTDQLCEVKYSQTEIPEEIQDSYVNSQISANVCCHTSNVLDTKTVRFQEVPLGRSTNPRHSDSESITSAAVHETSKLRNNATGHANSDTNPEHHQTCGDVHMFRSQPEMCDLANKDGEDTKFPETVCQRSKNENSSIVTKEQICSHQHVSLQVTCMTSVIECLQDKTNTRLGIECPQDTDMIYVTECQQDYTDMTCAPEYLQDNNDMTYVTECQHDKTNTMYDIDVQQNNTDMKTVPGSQQDNTNITSITACQRQNGNMTSVTECKHNNTDMRYVPECKHDNTDMTYVTECEHDNTDMTYVTECKHDNTDITYVTECKHDNTDMTSVTECKHDNTDMTSITECKHDNTGMTSVTECKHDSTDMIPITECKQKNTEMKSITEFKLDNTDMTSAPECKHGDTDITFVTESKQNNTDMTFVTECKHSNTGMTSVTECQQDNTDMTLAPKCKHGDNDLACVNERKQNNTGVICDILCQRDGNIVTCVTECQQNDTSVTSATDNTSITYANECQQHGTNFTDVEACQQATTNLTSAIEYHQNNTDTTFDIECQQDNTDMTSVSKCQQDDTDMTSVTEYQQDNTDMTYVTECQQDNTDMTFVTKCQQDNTDITYVTECHQDDIDMASATECQQNNTDMTPVTECQQDNTDMTSVTECQRDNTDMISVTECQQDNTDMTSVTECQQDNIDMTNVTERQHDTNDITPVTDSSNKNSPQAEEVIIAVDNVRLKTVENGLAAHPVNTDANVSGNTQLEDNVACGSPHADSTDETNRGRITILANRSLSGAMIACGSLQMETILSFDTYSKKDTGICLPVNILTDDIGNRLTRDVDSTNCMWTIEAESGSQGTVKQQICNVEAIQEKCFFNEGLDCFVFGNATVSESKDITDSVGSNGAEININNSKLHFVLSGIKCTTALDTKDVSWSPVLYKDEEQNVGREINEVNWNEKCESTWHDSVKESNQDIDYPSATELKCEYINKTIDQMKNTKEMASREKTDDATSISGCLSFIENSRTFEEFDQQEEETLRTGESFICSNEPMEIDNAENVFVSGERENVSLLSSEWAKSTTGKEQTAMEIMIIEDTDHVSHNLETCKLSNCKHEIEGPVKHGGINIQSETRDITVESEENSQCSSSVDLNTLVAQADDKNASMCKDFVVGINEINVNKLPNIEVIDMNEDNEERSVDRFALLSNTLDVDFPDKHWPNDSEKTLITSSLSHSNETYIDSDTAVLKVVGKSINNLSINDHKSFSDDYETYSSMQSINDNAELSSIHTSSYGLSVNCGFQMYSLGDSGYVGDTRDSLTQKEDAELFRHEMFEQITSDNGLETENLQKRQIDSHEQTEQAMNKAAIQVAVTSSVEPESSPITRTETESPNTTYLEQICAYSKLDLLTKSSCDIRTECDWSLARDKGTHTDEVNIFSHTQSVTFPGEYCGETKMLLDVIQSSEKPQSGSTQHLIEKTSQCVVASDNVSQGGENYSVGKISQDTNRHDKYQLSVAAISKGKCCSFPSELVFSSLEIESVKSEVANEKTEVTIVPDVCVLRRVSDANVEHAEILSKPVQPDQSMHAAKREAVNKQTVEIELGSGNKSKSIFSANQASESISARSNTAAEEKNNVTATIIEMTNEDTGPQEQHLLHTIITEMTGADTGPEEQHLLHTTAEVQFVLKETKNSTNERTVDTLSDTTMTYRVMTATHYTQTDRRDKYEPDAALLNVMATQTDTMEWKSPGPESANVHNADTDEQADWVLPVLRGVCHVVSTPDMPYLG